MNRKCLWLVLLVLPLLVAAQVEAQGLPTGTISGRVAETEGLALPGVTVTAKSPALQGTRTAVTNVNGDFVIPNLAPGDYVITFVMSGFQSVTRNVKVSANQQVPLNTKLSISSVASEVMVVAQSETVSQTSQGATTYSTELTNKLPVTRTLLSSVVLSPGVNTNGPNTAVTVSGAQSFDNVFTINGINIQDNIRGTPGNLFIEDAIQETTMMTSGVSAEYGRFTGGVINAVTKQGGNAFSGSFRLTLNNNDWNSQAPIAQNYVDKVIPTYEATLGGPIWKDRIWFFGAGRYQKDERNQQLSAPTFLSVPFTEEDTRYEGKLTISPFNNHTVTGSYTKQERDQTNYYFTPLPALDIEQVYDRQLPTDLFSVNYNGVLTSNLFVEAQYSQKAFLFQNSGSRYNELIKGTAVSILDRGYAMMWSTVFCAVCPGSSEARDNDNFLAKGTWFLSTKNLGSHSIVFGYDNFGSQRESNNWQSGSSWWLYASSVQYTGGNLFPVVDENSYMGFYPIPAVSKGSDMRTHSLFVNDSWRLNDRLSFNIGLRWDKNDATDQGGATTADDSAFSPRLAANFDVLGDGRLRLSASYAKYVGQIQESFAGTGATGAGSPSAYYYYWAPGWPTFNTPGGALTPTDEVLRQLFSYLGVTGLNQFPNIAPDAAEVPGVNNQIRETLDSSYVDEYVVGVGGTLGRNVVYRVDGVYRTFKDFYMLQRDTSTGQVEDAVGNVYDLGLFVNSNAGERKYAGLHTSLAYRVGNLNLAANWTWSNTYGNFVGENPGSGPISGTFLSYPEYFDVNWNAPKGSLSQDQRHRARLLASYDIKLGSLGITPGIVQSWDTGLAYGAVGSIASSPYVTNPGYVSPPSRVAYFFTPRDEYRTDDIWRTDLSLNLSANLGPVEIFIQPQVWNVFNADGVVTANTSVLTGTSGTPNPTTGLVGFNPFTTAPIECPQSASAAQCAASGANWKKGPSFGQPTAAGSFQRPRYYFITMGIRF